MGKQLKAKLKKLNVKDFLMKQMSNAQEQLLRKKELESGMKPDIWEIQKTGKTIDGYRVLEVEWINRHQSVQLHATPGYEVKIPGKEERRAWRAEVKGDWMPFIQRKRRLSPKLWNAKQTKYDL